MDNSKRSVYLDYAATTPVMPGIVEAINPYFSSVFGNPSSIHSLGREARQATEKARGQVASLLNAENDEIVFTSSGTEADNLALLGVVFANRNRGNHIITSSIEHPAILRTCKYLEKLGIEVTYLPVDRFGIIDPDDVKKAITPKTILISLMYANNEIGTLEPIAEISKTARDSGVYIHTDAVQAVGHLPLDVRTLGIDLLSLSGHKLYGPKGIGALFIKKGTVIDPILHGGGQEQQKRAGTENVPGIIGLGCASEQAITDIENENKRTSNLRDKFISSLLSEVDDCRLNGHPSCRLPNNINVSIKSIEGKTLCNYLEKNGIYASYSSACSATNLSPSHVLLATGLSRQEAYGSIRFSLGKWTCEQDIEYVMEILPSIVEDMVDGRLSGRC